MVLVLVCSCGGLELGTNIPEPAPRCTMGDGQSMAMSLVKLTDQPFQIHALIVLEFQIDLDDSEIVEEARYLVRMASVL